MEDLTQEEIEYRRYLRRRIRKRKRRRQLMIRRCIAAVVALCLLAGVFMLLQMGVRALRGGSKSDTKVSAVPKQTKKPISVNIPAGYEDLYSQLSALQKDYPQVEQIFLNFGKYPRDVIELAVNNQETMDFVVDYPKNIGMTVAGEIAPEEVGEGIPLFYQWDKRWGYVTYGGNIIAIDGCGPTCMSMVYCGLTKKTDKSPADMAAYSLENNYYNGESGTSWEMMLDGANNLGLSAQRIELNTSSIKSALRDGKPVICSMEPGDFTTQGHFIVLCGVDDSGKIILNDPNSKARSEKHWKLKKVLSQTKAAWSYSYEGQVAGDGDTQDGESQGDDT